MSNTYKIFGPDLAEINGKTMKKKPQRVVTDYVDIPIEIKMHLQKITLTGNVMFVNKIPFLVSFKRDIGPLTVGFSPKNQQNSWGRI